MRQFPSCRGPGFTLVELLVVISIVALLLALLIPTISQARVVTRIATCASNMRQIGNMMAQYNADCNQYSLVPKSPHQIAVGQSAGNDRFSTGSICDMTNAGSSGQTCPYGYPKTWPTGFGWFYWMGYLPPVPKKGKIGILDCAAEPSFRSYNMTYSSFEETFYGVHSGLSSYFQANNMDSGFNPEGANWDCNAIGSGGYSYRGWQMSYTNNTIYPKIDQWKTSLAVVIDNEYYDWYSSTFLGHHGNGLNIMFVDGHVSFGGYDIAYPSAGTNAALKPFVYYSMAVNGYSLSAANGSAGTPAGSGWAYPGGNGTARLWNYYETGQR